MIKKSIAKNNQRMYNTCSKRLTHYYPSRPVSFYINILFLNLYSGAIFPIAVDYMRPGYYHQPPTFCQQWDSNPQPQDNQTDTLDHCTPYPLQGIIHDQNISKRLLTKRKLGQY